MSLSPDQNRGDGFFEPVFKGKLRRSALGPACVSLDKLLQKINSRNNLNVIVHKFDDFAQPD